MQPRSLFSWSSQSNGEGGPKAVTILCGKHYENMMSKQEPEHRKGIWGQGGLPGGSDVLISKTHHPLGKKARTRR